MKKYFWIIFWTLSTIIFIGLIIAWVLAELAIRHRFGYSTRGSLYLPMFITPIIAVALVLSLVICNGLGILEFNRTVEVFKRNPASAPVTQSVELRSPPSLYVGLASVFGVMALGTAIAVWRLPAVSGTKIYGYALAAFFALMGALCLLGVLKRGEFLARINQEGVRGSSKTALWKDIATLETATQKTPYGMAVTCTLKDTAGKTLTMFTASRAGEAEWKAFLDVLKNQFVPAEKFPPDSGTPQEGIWPPPPKRGKDA